jgi:hypothetical protein
LLVRFFTQGGTNITIMFPGVYGIDPSSSNIEYRGMTVGSVTGVDLSKRETRSRSARALSTAPPNFSGAKPSSGCAAPIPAWATFPR